MGKVNMARVDLPLVSPRRPVQATTFLEMRAEQREVCRRQRREKTITGARRTSHHERLLPSENTQLSLECLWQKCLLRCADTN